MEQIILETISRHIKDKSSPQGVTLDHLITFYNEMTAVVDEVMHILCLNFCKAFDTDSHKIVMQQVMKYRLAEQKVNCDENWRVWQRTTKRIFSAHKNISKGR